MGRDPLCPNPEVWRLGLITLFGSCVVLHLAPVRDAVPCPACGVQSRRIHSRYTRKASDLPWGSWPVRLVIHARRFFCDRIDCARRIFTERFPGSLEPFARQTERLRNKLLELVHSSNGQMASRMAKLLGFPTSGDTLIRRQRQEAFDLPTPMALGVDQFALRRGSTYGTILVDLQHHRPIDVLEERTAKPLAAWLSGHKGVKVLARDRAEAYAYAGKIGAPDAIQVADRFHLVRNASDALKELVRSSHWRPLPARSEAFPQPASDQPRREPQPTSRKRALWEAVQKLRESGISLSAIASELGICFRTARRYVVLNTPPVNTPRPPSISKLAAHLPYLRERWIQGCHNSRQLYRELLEQGYKGGDTQVRRLVRPWRQAGIPSAKHPSSPLWLLLRSSDSLNDPEKEELELLLTANPLLSQGHQFKESFRRIVAQRDVAGLEKWIEDAAGSPLAPFMSMAKTLRHDFEAVKAALSTPWSTAQVEGQNTRVKLIKRLGYGRAKPDLLRVRILHRMAAA